MPNAYGVSSTSLAERSIIVTASAPAIASASPSTALVVARRDRSRAGSTAMLTPSVAGGRRPDAHAAVRPGVDSDRRALDLPDVVNATAATVASVISTTTSAPRTTTGASTRNPRSGSARRASPRGNNGERAIEMATAPAAPMTATGHENQDPRSGELGPSDADRAQRRRRPAPAHRCVAPRPGSSPAPPQFRRSRTRSTARRPPVRPPG